ncbi:hypothetical protein BC831DRAFT_45994 [Entophlyctis helioformis]|nr:hypothetical protein BC831DRAFT_45994 [Entophlyctis helioformis]
MADTALLWCVQPSVGHPLRETVVGDGPFVLISARPPANSDGDQEPSIQLIWRDLVHVGSSSSSRSDQAAHRIAEPACSWKTLQPLPVDEARHALSLFMLCAKEARIAVPVFCFVAVDADTHSYMGIRPMADDRMSVVRLADTGHATLKNRHIQLPFLDGILQEAGMAAVKATCFAKYEILASPPDEPAGKQQVASTIDLAVHWESHGHQVCALSPEHPTKAVLRVLCEPGSVDQDSYVAVGSLRRQLETLKSWNRIQQTQPGWESFQDAQENGGIDAEPSADEPALLSVAVEEFLVAAKARSHSQKSKAETHKPRVSGTGTACDTSTDASNRAATMAMDGFSLLSKRSDHDFVETLWTFCQSARDRHDLTDAITAIIEELETGRLLPHVAKDNQSLLANVVRSCLKATAQQQSTDAKEQWDSISAIFDYWLEQPLEYLVDAGIWKLKRDYMFHLLDSNLVLRHQLEPFMDASLSFDDQIQRLHCLHRTLELLHLVRSNILSIPDEVLRTLMTATLKHYKELLDAVGEHDTTSGEHGHERGWRSGPL